MYYIPLQMMYIRLYIIINCNQCKLERLLIIIKISYLFLCTRIFYIKTKSLNAAFLSHNTFNNLNDIIGSILNTKQRICTLRKFITKPYVYNMNKGQSCINLYILENNTILVYNINKYICIFIYSGSIKNLLSVLRKKPSCRSLTYRVPSFSNFCEGCVASVNSSCLLNLILYITDN